MDDLILHPNTQTQVAQFIRQPSHALLLIGANGIGKTSIAIALIAAVLQLTSAQLASYPYIRIVGAEKGSISIEAIRELRTFLQLKTIGNKQFRRAILIEHADMLTLEAQNAFLKILEEPPADTLIIMTVSSQRALLATIVSRLQAIPVVAPREATLIAHFKELQKDTGKISQAYFLSGGLPGLMHALLDESSEHPLLNAVAQAKLMLQSSGFERLVLVETIAKQKDQAILTLEALLHIAQTGLSQATTKQDEPKIKQWHHILKLTAAALQSLAGNANTKLVISNFALQL